MASDKQVKSHKRRLEYAEKKGNLKRKTESLIAAQNIAIRTNYVKTKIDKMQENSKCRLCGHRDETINYITSEFNKLAQKEFKTRYNWEGYPLRIVQEI